MPYVSPKGNLSSKPPPKKLPTSKASKTGREERGAADSPASSEAPKYVPSVYLEVVSSRDRDAFVVRELEHWKGWGAPRESPEEELDIDPLDGVGAGIQSLQVGENNKDGLVEVREMTVEAGT